VPKPALPSLDEQPPIAIRAFVAQSNPKPKCQPRW
jgi:hypothetical protein